MIGPPGATARVATEVKWPAPGSVASTGRTFNIKKKKPSALDLAGRPVATAFGNPLFLTNSANECCSVTH